jgi:hypothetical protein
VCRKVAHLKEREVVHRSGSLACACTGRARWRCRGPKPRASLLSQACLFMGSATTKLKVWRPRRHEALIFPVTGQAVPPAEGAKRELGPPGCRLDVAEGGLARAARSKREAGSQFGRNHHGGAPKGRVHLGGKKNPSKLDMDVIRSMCTPNGIPRGAG